MLPAPVEMDQQGAITEADIQTSDEEFKTSDEVFRAISEELRKDPIK